MNDDFAILITQNIEPEDVLQFSAAILNTLNEHVAVVNRSGNIIATNNAWQHLVQQNRTDVSIQPVIYSNYLEFCQQADGVSESDAQALLAGISAVLSGKHESFQFEYTCFSPPKTHYFLISVTPVIGEWDGAIISNSNITKRKMAEPGLHTSKQRFRSMADTMPVFIWMSGLGKGCTFFNKQWLEFTERTHEQEAGDGWVEGIHPDDRERRLNIYTNAFDKCEDFNMEYRMRRYDGEYRWIEDTGKPNYMEDGTFTGYIGSCIDITERKRIELQLQEEKNFSDAIIESIPGLFYMLDREGRYIRWNKKMEQATGCCAEKILNAPAMNFVRTEEREKCLQTIETVFRDGYDYAEYDKITVNGHVTYSTWGIRTHINDQDYMVGVEIDISERKRAEQESCRLRKELSRVSRLATVGGLGAALAHELNQPLTAILNNASAAQHMLAQDQPDIAEVREILGDIVSDDRRAGAIIQRLRALLVKGEPERTAQDINKIVQEVIELVRSEAAEKDIELIVQPEDSLPQVMVDRVQMQQVVLNLIVNGFDAMQDLDGHKQLQILTTHGSADTIKLAVVDSGPGLDEDKIQNMFDAFFTTKPQGMGMGLSISRTIIDDHGGRLWASNNHDQGMSLHIELPTAGEK